jgi:hypothetical protein
MREIGRLQRRVSESRGLCHFCAQEWMNAGSYIECAGSLRCCGRERKGEMAVVCCLMYDKDGTIGHGFDLR